MTGDSPILEEDATSEAPAAAHEPTGAEGGLAALIVEGEEAVAVSAAGEVESFRLRDAPAIVLNRSFLVCHAKLTAARLQVEVLDALDILELFAFVHPGRFSVPTPRGLAAVLDLPMPDGGGASAALTLWRARDVLLADLAELTGEEAVRACRMARAMVRGGWRWGRDVLSALPHLAGEEPDDGTGTDPAASPADPVRALGVWNRLPEWEEITPLAEQPATVTSQDVRTRLADLVGSVLHAEPRPEQGDYASGLCPAFEGGPAAGGESGAQVVLAEAGTGVGKTLGYLAPASLWAAEAGRAVWVSTYTRNLQRQIEQEARRLPDTRTVVRKGRENYLCLLNFEESLRASFGQPRGLVGLGLVARWLDVTRDGDLRGGDLPGWMADVVGRGRLAALADRRGECLHGACPHYRRCFIERSVRAARQADIVIANHALILSATASGGVDERHPPSRFIFDEGHHLFHAADSAFGSDLSGMATHDLRRWVLGGEGRSKGRVRGLSRRAEPLLPDAAEGLALLDIIRQQAAFLPAEGWLARVEKGEPHGTTERFLEAVRTWVLEKTAEAATPTPYTLEWPVDKEGAAQLEEIASALRAAVDGLARKVEDLIALLAPRGTPASGATPPSDQEEREQQHRTDSLLRTLRSYVLDQLASWKAMLDSLRTQPEKDESSTPLFCDWFGMERIDGRTLDIGFFRRYRDPVQPMADALGRQAAGVVVTSATLTDPGGSAEEGWAAAEAETGARHFPRPAYRVRVPSPFDYARQTRVFVVTGVDGKDTGALTRAYRDLFLASGGGALGLFTAIERLKRVHAGLRLPLARAGLPLYAQHLDGLDPHTLIDIFRAEGNACLLGTDAVRDGVDVPGRALRLIVFDRIPWPRTDLLLKSRKEIFGGAAYVERLARQRLRQAFGRLVRRADDRGVFVLLSPLPSRLAPAFPGVVPERVSLSEAVDMTQAFLA